MTRVITIKAVNSTTPATPAADLSVITASIQDELDASLASANNAIQHAINAGQLLTKAKASLGHGNWASWLSENFELSSATAKNYMRLAEHQNLLIELNRQQSSDLTNSTIRDALKVISEHDRKPHPGRNLPVCKQIMADDPEPAPASPETAPESSRCPEITYCSGLSYCVIAISQMERIHKKDRQRAESFIKMFCWLMDQGGEEFCQQALLRLGGGQ